jgi:hypothetical protein
MWQSFFRLAAVLVTLMAACFLSEGSLTLTAEQIAELSTTKLCYNADVARSLAAQEANARVGLIAVLVAFLLQLLSLRGGQYHWRLRPILGAVSLVTALGLIAWWYASSQAATTYHAVLQLLEVRCS